MSPFTHLLVSLAPLLQGAQTPESTYYTVDHLVAPEGTVVEAGGMAWMPDGRLALSTRRGQVWLVENPLAAHPRDARFHLYAEGLQEGLGLAFVDGQLLVLQRGELSRLVDEDGDGHVERIDTLSNDWGNSGHYHEFAFGLPHDAAGNLYASFNVSFGDPKWWMGRSDAPYRGWVLRIAPDGTTTPVASGFRSPAGLGTNHVGDLFATDNQGDWMPACPIFHVREGRFYGHPASLRWTDEYQRAGRTPSDSMPPERERASAAVWIPYDWSRSTGSLVSDDSGGLFGPFGSDLFVAEMTNGYVLRAQLETVQGEYQGAVFPFRRGVGSAVRVLFGEDGTLFAGLTERGWGGQDPGSGVARVRWTGELPMEIARVHLLQDGFELGFTRPLAADASLAAVQVAVEQYDYDYWWEYGSPLRHVTPLEVSAVLLSQDRRTAVLRIPGLRAGMVARVRLEGVVGEDGHALLHDEFAYTINQLPEGPRQDVHVAKLVPPPPPRESGNEGVLMLTQTDGLDLWRAEGWVTGGVRLDADEPARLLLEEPREEEDRHRARTLSNLGAETPSNLISRFEFGDLDMSLRFMLPKDGNSGLYVMGRYEVQLRDNAGRYPLGFGDCGGLYEGDGNGWPGKAPDFDAFRGAGEWHSLSVRFQAPRFDEGGHKIANARFQRVMIDDVLLQDEIELPGPTRGALFASEAPMGPLMIQGDHGPVAIRDVTVRDRRAIPDEQGWTRVFDGESLEGWEQTDGGLWTVEDGSIVGRGPSGHLFSPRGDYRDLEFRARVKINQGGNSGMYFRVALGPGWPAGYEAQVNSTHADPVKTGSLYNHALLRGQMIPPDVWFTQHVTCRDEEGGVRVTIRVNGVLVNEFLDTEGEFQSGHVALQQHHEGSEVRYRDVEVRELR